MNQTPSDNITEKIKKSLSQKPTPKIWFKLQNISLLLSAVLGLILAFISFDWMISQAKIFFVFWPFITTSWSGWFWVVIPEFAIFGSIFIVSIYFIYKRTDWFGVAWADIISSGFIVLILFTSFLLPVDALESVPNIGSIRQNFLTLPYRIWLRDQHIIDLEQKFEYYGVITKLETNQISIDHGGVVLDFKADDTSNLKLSQRIWVKFEAQNGARNILDYRVW